MKEKFVIVPQADIDSIEKARKELWKFYEQISEPLKEHEKIYMMTQVHAIAQPMWFVAYRKYPVKKSIWDKVVDFFSEL